MILLTTAKLTNAIARAKKIRPRVTWLGGRSFAVSGSKGNTYTVHFAVARDAQGKQVCLGVCDCDGGKNLALCYHVAASAAVNIGIQSARVHTKAQLEMAAESARESLMVVLNAS